MAVDAKKALPRDAKYVVSEIITDSVTEEKGAVLKPVGEYPGRDVEVGDVFSPVDFDPALADD